MGSATSTRQATWFLCAYNVQLASKLKADGVHLGQTDEDPLLARKVLGVEKIIGLSIESVEELKKANNLNVDLTYVAASAIFTSKSKSNIKTLWGIRGLKKLVKLSNYPVVAIGGINQNNIEEVIETGASGVAIIGAIHETNDPEKEVKQLRNIIDKAYRYV